MDFSYATLHLHVLALRVSLLGTLAISSVREDTVSISSVPYSTVVSIVRIDCPRSSGMREWSPLQTWTRQVQIVVRAGNKTD